MKIKLSYNDILIYSVLFITYGTLMYFSSPLRRIYYVLLPLTAVFLLIKYGKEFCKSGFVWIILASQVWNVISTALNGNIAKENFFRFASIISLICLFNSENIKDNLIIKLKNFFMVISIIDMITVLYLTLTNQLTTTGSGWMGHKNYHAVVYILALGFLDYCQEQTSKKRNWQFKVFAVLCVSFTIVLKSASSLLALLFFLVCIFIIKNKNWSMFNLYTVFLSDIVIFYFVVYKQYVGTILNYFLTILGKDSGFTGRSVMWTAAFIKLKQMPFYGYGENVTVLFYRSTQEKLLNHVHNFILHLIVSGGWIYAAVIFFIFMYAAKCLKNSQDKYISKTLLYIITAYLIIGQSEILVNINNMLLPLIFLTTKLEDIEVK